MNKESVLRDLDYIYGGMAALRTLCQRDSNKEWYNLMEDWCDVISNVIAEIEDD